MTEEKKSFVMGAYIDWSKKKESDRLRDKLVKMVKKKLGTRPLFNKLNSFFVISVEFNRKISAETIDSLEEDLKEQLQDYATRINTIYRQELIEKGDLSDIYVSELKANRYKIIALKLKKNFYQSMELVAIGLEKLINGASIFIWDLPGVKKDRIRIRDHDFEFEKQQTDLPSYIDELIISIFAIYFIPYSKVLVNDLLLELNRLQDLLKNFPTSSKFPEELQLLSENFIGTISSLQESIKLFSREILLVNEYAVKAKQVLLNLKSEQINIWAENQLFSGTDTINELNQLSERINQIKPQLKEKLTGEDDLSREDMSEVLKIYANIFPRSINLAHWASYFQEIPNFTSLDNDIGYESVTDEEYNPRGKCILESQKLFKIYTRGSHTIYALRGVDICIKEGEFVVIRGPSGAGKTTLLNMLAGLDIPDRGTVFFRNSDINQMEDDMKSELRAQEFSFVFQNYALISHLTAYENAKIPLDFGDFPKDLKKEVDTILEDVGIFPYRKHKPALLSGGQMQRLGIARALVKRPSILFADEPTGDLDQETGKIILQLFKKYHEELNITIVMVTHDETVKQYADREILLQDGQIVPKLHA